MNDDAVFNGIAALANKSRWRIFWLLVSHDGMRRSAGEISNLLEIAPATLSFHLKELTQVGLLHSTRSGNRVIYSSDTRVVGEIAGYIARKCSEQ